MAGTGIGVGDIIQTCKFIYEVCDAYRGSLDEFDEVAEKARSLRLVLLRLDDEARENGSLFERGWPKAHEQLQDNLASLRRDCAKLEALVTKYARIHHEGPGRRMLWVIREHSGLADLRRSIGYHEATLQMWYWPLIFGSLRRLENGQEAIIDALKSMRREELEQIRAELRRHQDSHDSHRRPEGAQAAIDTLRKLLHGRGISPKHIENNLKLAADYVTADPQQKSTIENRVRTNTFMSNGGSAAAAAAATVAAAAARRHGNTNATPEIFFDTYESPSKMPSRDPTMGGSGSEQMRRSVSAQGPRPNLPKFRSREEDEQAQIAEKIRNLFREKSFSNRLRASQQEREKALRNEAQLGRAEGDRGKSRGRSRHSGRDDRWDPLGTFEQQARPKYQDGRSRPRPQSDQLLYLRPRTIARESGDAQDNTHLRVPDEHAHRHHHRRRRRRHSHGQTGSDDDEDDAAVASDSGHRRHRRHRRHSSSHGGSSHGSSSHSSHSSHSRHGSTGSRDRDDASTGSYHRHRHHRRDESAIADSDDDEDGSVATGRERDESRGSYVRHRQTRSSSSPPRRSRRDSGDAGARHWEQEWVRDRKRDEWGSRGITVLDRIDSIPITTSDGEDDERRDRWDERGKRRR